MNTGIGDACDLAWKLAALVRGFGGPGLLEAYDDERRPVGLRNRLASGAHTDVRVAIAQAYAEAGNSLDESSFEADRRRTALAARIAALGNAENESYGIELGYAYPRSPIVCAETDAEISDDPVRYVPTTAPGGRLPSILLADGSALFDRLGPWFTLIAFGVAPDAELVAAAGQLGMPLEVVCINQPGLEHIYRARCCSCGRISMLPGAARPRVPKPMRSLPAASDGAHKRCWAVGRPNSGLRTPSDRSGSCH
jgi:hypothetical protein